MSFPRDLWHRDVVTQFSNTLLDAALPAKETLLGSLMRKRDESRVTLAGELGARTELDPTPS